MDLSPDELLMALKACRRELRDMKRRAAGYLTFHGQKHPDMEGQVEKMRRLVKKMDRALAG